MIEKQKQVFVNYWTDDLMMMNDSHATATTSESDLDDQITDSENLTDVLIKSVMRRKQDDAQQEVMIEENNYSSEESDSSEDYDDDDYLENSDSSQSSEEDW